MMRPRSIDFSSLLPFTSSDIRVSLSSKSCTRGESYARQGRVAIIEISDGGQSIEGAVIGSARRPYQVFAVIRKDRSYTSVGGSCDCPVGRGCKHVAALLFEVLAARERENASEGTLFAIPPSKPLPSPRIPPKPDPVSARVMYWLEMMERVGATRDAAPETGNERVAYVFDPRIAPTRNRFPVHMIVERLTKTGRWAKIRDTTADALVAASSRAIAKDDTAIGRVLKLYETAYSGKGAFVDDTVRRIIATGQAHFERADAAPLVLGPARTGRLMWRVADDGSQRLDLTFDDPDVRALFPGAPWCVHVTSATCGPIETGFPREGLAEILDSPPIAISEVAHVRDAIQRVAPHLELPPPREIAQRIVDLAPIPVLRLRTARGSPPTALWQQRRYATGDGLVDLAEVSFAYGDVTIAPMHVGNELRQYDGNALNIIPRAFADEERALLRLIRDGLVRASEGTVRAAPGSGALFTFPLEEEYQWREFAHRGIAQLRTEGWRVEIDASFRRRVVDLDDDALWSTHVTERAGGWFDLAMGLEIEGKRYDLVPILRRLLQTNVFSDPAALARKAAGEPLYLLLPGHTATIALPGPRIAAILTTLVELHDPEVPIDATLRLPRARAAAFGELEAAAGLRWDLPARVRELSDKLRTFGGIERVAVPSGFRGELRAYQRDGLDWLQFLAQYGFGGILADDMGLGKSVQTLAHLLREKEARRMKHPALLVVPTTLVFNWCAEAERFAPKLRVLALHGPERAERFAEISKHDLVITTYALLVRDAVLQKREWHAVILDEAQAIKNPLSKAAQVAMGLRAEHRLLLTGTPVENHLGDLWSLFSIALPGALGDRKEFGRLFRTPIEKRGDALRSASLAQRIRPFLLRRTKETVAAELPEKTEIVHRVDLGGPQRDLYETIRVAMHDRVREEIEKRGLARSQIVILDALLKLRQVCCDPRLLPESIRKSAPSAKLEALLEMLPQMVEEGRRVLVFSQFTSMLDLLEPELNKLEIPFVVLTGQTKDRATVVRRFQANEVPVFLISLKAGGTGLNLTAADTVIHYDPWWNPAVERQATDRAHRIGQLQHVFVYKLIGAGTLEEKILDLQVRKAKLAASIFAEAGGAGPSISAADVELLFAPIG